MWWPFFSYVNLCLVKLTPSDSVKFCWLASRPGVHCLWLMTAFFYLWLPHCTVYLMLSKSKPDSSQLRHNFYNLFVGGFLDPLFKLHSNFSWKFLPNVYYDGILRTLSWHIISLAFFPFKLLLWSELHYCFSSVKTTCSPGENQPWPWCILEILLGLVWLYFVEDFSFRFMRLVWHTSLWGYSLWFLLPPVAFHFHTLFYHWAKFPSCSQEFVSWKISVGF